MATIVYRAGTEDGPSFDSDETINEGKFYLLIHWSYIILSSFTYQKRWQVLNIHREEITNLGFRAVAIPHDDRRVHAQNVSFM